MYHAAAADFEPAAAAYSTAFTAAQETFHVKFRRWFGKGEVRSAEAGAYLLAEQTARQVRKSAFQVRERDAGTHGQPFNLIELGLVAGVGLFIAVAHTRQDNAYRRGILRVGGRRFLHGMHLARRGVGAHHDRVISTIASLDKVSVLHIACRVADGEVEHLKVKLVGLDFARAVHLKAHLSKDAVKFT
jgi:hypothetical protein